LVLLFKLLTGNVQWTKTGATPAVIARVKSSSAIGLPTENVGATFETIADEMNDGKKNQKMNEKILETMNDKIGIKTKNVPCGMKSPRQLIANTKVIDATVITAVTKSDGNGTGRDCPLPTNDAALDHIDSGFACQCQCQCCQGCQDCPIDETGMNNIFYKVIRSIETDTIFNCDYIIQTFWLLCWGITVV
jgi:hypothetical protein